MEKQVFQKLLKELKKYGAIGWHKSLNNSYYIKFKDTRIGSIRIANHDQLEKYNYTYKIDTIKDDLSVKIPKIIKDIETKISNINNFNPDKYIVFIDGKYQEVLNHNEYKNCILKGSK